MRLQTFLLRRHFQGLFHTRMYHNKPARCDAHMNELPVPCIPWEPWYTNKQRLYNMQLLFGIAWWFFSLGMVIYTESMYLNWGPPKQPGPPSDMVEECEDPDA